MPTSKNHWMVDSLNSNRDVLTADAAGIVVTAFTLWDLANRTQDRKHIEFYECLRGYETTHPEAHKIYRALD